MRIFPNGQISETRSIVVAISQSASSFNFSLTVFKCISQLISSLTIAFAHGVVTLTQSTSVVDRFDSFLFHALHQLCRCEFLHQVRRYDEAAIVITAPRNRDAVDNRWR